MEKRGGRWGHQALQPDRRRCQTNERVSGLHFYHGRLSLGTWHWTSDITLGLMLSSRFHGDYNFTSGKAGLCLSAAWVAPTHVTRLSIESALCGPPGLSEMGPVSCGWPEYGTFWRWRRKQTLACGEHHDWHLQETYFPNLALPRLRALPAHPLPCCGVRNCRMVRWAGQNMCQKGGTSGTKLYPK